jgi:hypothetical protein
LTFETYFLKKINISKIRQLPSNMKKYYGNFFCYFIFRLNYGQVQNAITLDLWYQCPIIFIKQLSNNCWNCNICGNYNSTYSYLLLLLLFSCNFIMKILNHVRYDDNMFKVRFEPLPFNHHLTWWQKISLQNI